MYKTPFTVLSNSEAGLGAFVACQYDGLPVSGISSNNKCYALPIALVQRLNQGAITLATTLWAAKCGMTLARELVELIGIKRRPVK